MQPPETRADLRTGTDTPDLRTESFRYGELSWPSRILIALTVGVLATFTVWHLTAAFLFVAPSNTLSKEQNHRINGYVNPEFEQNWKLFAPNPLQINVRVEARAEIRQPDGSTETTDWIDLTAMDLAGIRGSLLPSHTMQNEMRRGWDLYRNSHDDDGRPRGVRGELSESYVHRIALLRLARVMDLEPVNRIQLRSASTRVAPPPWSTEEYDTSTNHHELEWRTVLAEDLPRGALARSGAATVAGATGGAGTAAGTGGATGGTGGAAGGERL